MCEKFGKRMPIGNVETGLKYSNINESIDKFAAIRNELCTNDCWAQRVCMPCIQTAKDFGEDISKEGLAQTCKNSKKDILSILGLYSSISKSDSGFLERYAHHNGCKEVKNERNL